MLAIHRDFVLENKAHHHVHVAVIPNGTLEIDVEESREHYCVDLDQIAFEQKGKITWMICIESPRHCDTTQWKIPMCRKDAFDLAHLIDDAEDDLEILMRDLI
ncbi:hypothetical protein NF212_07955 [Parasalinivibrio latis]|uniref:hypothetical protein n=1 Tax=Parasalinivibrio latis TaxID=2952610 RepID=UPI0030E2A90E